MEDLLRNALAIVGSAVIGLAILFAVLARWAHRRSLAALNAKAEEQAAKLANVQALEHYPPPPAAVYANYLAALGQSFDESLLYRIAYYDPGPDRRPSAGRVVSLLASPRGVERLVEDLRARIGPDNLKREEAPR